MGTVDLQTAQAQEVRRVFSRSMTGIGVMTIFFGISEILLVRDRYWVSACSLSASLLFIAAALMARRGRKLEGMVWFLLLAGVPYLVARILWSTGVAGSTMIWFAVFPLYIILLGYRKMTGFSMAYSMLGAVATFVLQERFNSYFRPLHTTYPSELGLMLTIIVVVTLAYGLYLYDYMRMRLERMLESQMVSQENSRRLAIVGELAGGIAHEINNPLATIQLVTEMIRDNPERWSDVKFMNEHVEMLLAVVSRMSATINSLLNFSRKRVDEGMSVESFERIIKDTLMLCSYRLKKSGVELRLNFNGLERGEIWCRPNEISQVLIALLTNAVDAAESESSRWVEVRVEDHPDVHVIDVVNGGPPIPVEVAERMFEPYFTTKGPGRGTGLGLSVALGLVKGHGGELIHLSHTRSTCFRIKLPKPTGEVSHASDFAS